MNYPSAGGSINGFRNDSHDITAGTTMTFTATQKFNFLGWYVNDKFISSSYTISYTMPEYDVILEARYSSN